MKRLPIGYMQIHLVTTMVATNQLHKSFLCSGKLNFEPYLSSFSFLVDGLWVLQMRLPSDDPIGWIGVPGVPYGWLSREICKALGLMVWYHCVQHLIKNAYETSHSHHLTMHCVWHQIVHHLDFYQYCCCPIQVVPCH